METSKIQTSKILLSCSNMCAFLLTHYKSVSNNASNFQVVLSVNGILKYLRQL